MTLKYNRSIRYLNSNEKKGWSVGMEIRKRVLTGNEEIWRGFESDNLLQQNARLHLRSNIYGNFIASLDYI